MSFATLVLTRSEGIATLTFNRPEKLNAMSPEMAGELRQALEEISQDAAIRVLVFRGEGRAFMAGADVHTFLEATPLSIRRFIQRAHDFLFRLEALEIPVIAAIHGFALGAGFEIALACDFIYAAEGAKLGLPETSLGIIPGAGGTQRLTRLVGRAAAKEIIMTGRMVDAGEAKTMGIVAQVFPEDKLYEETLKTAQTLARKGRVSLRAAKQAVDRGANVDLRTGCALEVDLFALCFAGPDPQEGARAFLEKRPPVFKGELE
jgi:enoyl-CoA hydratase